MSQATRRWISEKVKSLHESDVLPFHDILDAEMVNAALASAGVTFKERIYTPFVTLCMFLSQVLDPDHSCRAAVARLIVWLAVNDRKPCSPDTSSYCDARQRLPLEVIVELVHQTARKIEAGASDQWLWKGRRVSLVDGTTVRCPTPRRTSGRSRRRILRASAWDSRWSGCRDHLLGDRGGSRPGAGPVQGEGDGRDGAVPHSAGWA